VDEFRNVVVVKLELFQGKQVLDVFQASGDQIVHRNDVVAILNEPITQM
jgi:hypothetical protein